MQLLQAGRSLKNINVSMETSFIRNYKKFKRYFSPPFTFFTLQFLFNQFHVASIFYF